MSKDDDEPKEATIGFRTTAKRRALLEEFARQDKRKLGAYVEIVLAEHIEQRLKQRGTKKK